MHSFLKQHEHLYAVLLIMAATLCVVLMNGFAKSISYAYDPFETVFIRSSIALIIIASFLFLSKRKENFKTKNLKGQIGRAVAGTFGLALVFWGFSLMPMANMQALMLTGGLMTTAFAPLLLKEHVGIYRWSAVIAGFIGAIFIIQPLGVNFMGWHSLIGLIAAFWGGTLTTFFLRTLGKKDSTWTTNFYFLLIGSIMTLPYCLWNDMRYVEGTLIGVLGTAIAGGLSLLLKTQAYRYAEASSLSPVFYMGMVWAILVGWIGFNEIPDRWVLFGSALIIISNLFILWREHTKKKQIKK